MIAFIPLAFAAAAHSSALPSSLTDQLRANDQALLDATAPGDKRTWDRLLAEDAVYVDENGVILNRAKFLEELVPLPSYASGHIDIIDYQVHRYGETALVIHRDNEYETYHGIQLRAQYLMTETWIHKGSAWRLALTHVYVVAPDPPATRIAPSLLESYVGRYRLTDGVTYVIRLEGDHLVGGPDGAPAKPLLAETTDVFFIAGQPRSRKLFQREGDRVTGFIDRREAEDLVYTRLSTSEAAARADPFADFEGQWKCTGLFVKSGKPIASHITATWDGLTSALVLHQDDQPPNHYHALMIWGAGPSGFRSTIADAYSGIRWLVSPGWEAGQLVWTRRGDKGPAERFTFSRPVSGVFNVEWSPTDASGAFVPGDRLRCEAQR